MAEEDFEGFPKETLSFLRRLKANNNREWFAEHKTDYAESVKRPAERFCASMTRALHAMTGHGYRSKIFRIHRDLRFSKDKTPYNTHLHISFFPEGAPGFAPGWYFALELDQAVLGTGVFAFDKRALAVFRDHVDGVDGDTLARVLDRLQCEGVRLSQPDLQRVPRGFPVDHRCGDLLRRKGITAWIHVDDPRSMSHVGMVEDCLAHYSRLRPVFDWLMAAKA